MVKLARLNLSANDGQSIKYCRYVLSRCPRVDHLYAFFVQWSPDVYGKEAREQGFVVVDELDMIDNFFSDPASCSWEVDHHKPKMYCAPPPPPPPQKKSGPFVSAFLYKGFVFKCMPNHPNVPFPNVLFFLFVHIHRTIRMDM